tara:strand:- start:35003 stop:35500 length:498 start_codon:yes stop_codon:yes gene_type:complete
MKKKLTNGLLIVGVLIIWVFVFRRASGAYLQEPEENLVAIPTDKKYILSNFTKDTFALNDFDRDPFLDIKKTNKPVKIKAVNSAPVGKKTKFQPNATTSTKLWPKIEYMGYMKKTDSQDKLALIRINNKLFRAREKETVEELYIKQVFKDSVILKWGAILKTIRK